MKMIKRAGWRSSQSLYWEAATLLKQIQAKVGGMDPGGYVKVKCIASGRRCERNTFLLSTHISCFLISMRPLLERIARWYRVLKLVPSVDHLSSPKVGILLRGANGDELKNSETCGSNMVFLQAYHLALETSFLA
ncbi:hypothetical protein NC652_007763 [Populus alba x Populus x berolinensis]|nr:hypothetical protein NC652_007763 [Populus alba x Populus x berolinensis]